VACYMVKASPYLVIIDVFTWPVVVAALGTICFACFTWGTVCHFVRKAGQENGAWVISLLSLSGLALFLARTLSGQLSQGWVVACLLFVLSIGLWAWTLVTTRVTPPTLAFTGDEPRFLVSSGPYRWVRHPFYCAYLLFWVGTAMATQGIVGWAFALVIGAVYLAAARYEEGKFARSAYATCYSAYALRTGMFHPRLWTSSRCSSSK